MKRFPEGREPRPLKWRGWTIDGKSLGVTETFTEAEAIAKFRKQFGTRFHQITDAYLGAEPTTP